ncbi:HipA domain-containing protein [Aquabacterium sp. A7-Y]|uniref:HipA domain-containing protein n=1 Tax=Aquabacterium sp. A7-Y TaxID=1349605 RepID=UPI00223CB21D|nr:HipA domain-containing protein [Aquabacterium sp. A7-Y]MCW7541079.1 HipA domain-containing protein [Aquabacterium sp. A7-Y]
MTRLQVWMDRDLVGHLSHDLASNRFSFEYTAQWKADARRFPLSPRLPLVRDPAQTDEWHSTEVRQFFENLLPEGQALDDAAQANGLSKANLIGLVIALGRETSGALRILVESPGDPAIQIDADEGETLRPLSREELSQRIRQRSEIPFSVWDGKVRLSIAGYQDKLAVYERDARWFLVDGPDLASTWILKPAPTRPQLAHLPANEYFCMQLAWRAGLPVAATRLVHVPEPVLLVQRFDRADPGERVQRLHVIDGCQALGLGVGMKYERPYGDRPEVRNIRGGASFSKLFALTGMSPTPAVERLALLRWVLFQVLIGNTDAHGKNLSFFCAVDGLRLAPAYDLVCMPALGDDALGETYAMAIGDAFSESEITPFEWASFAKACGLPRRLVSQQLGRLTARLLDALPQVGDDARKVGVPDPVIQAVAAAVEPVCRRHLAMAPAIARARDADL